MQGSTERRAFPNQASSLDRKAITNTDRHAMPRYANFDSKGAVERSAYQKAEMPHKTARFCGDKIFKEREKQKNEMETYTSSAMQFSNSEFAQCDVMEEQKNNVLEKTILEKSEGEATGISKKNKRLAYHEIAECLLESDDFRVEDDILLHYEANYGYWKLLPSSNENRELRSCIPEEFYGEICKQSLSELYEWLIIKAKPFNENKDARNYINLKDAAFEWHTETFVKDRKSLGFRYYLSAKKENLHMKSTGEFQKYLTTVFQDDFDSQRAFKRFLGITLAGIRDQKQAFILHGVSNSGKTLFLNVLSKLFGTGLVSSLSFSQLADDFAITHLLGKSINVTGELSGTSHRRLDLFKSLTGNDKISLSYKHKDQMRAFPRCLLIFATNVYPEIKDVRELQSFFSRIVIFSFKYAVPREDWVNGYEELLLADRGAILRAAVEGLQDWENDSCQIVESRAMREAKDAFKMEYDSFSFFIEDCVRVNPKSKVFSREIGNYYERYCEQQGFIALASNQWPVLLKQLMPVVPKHIEKMDPTTGEIIRGRGYKGIELIPWNPGQNNVPKRIFE